METKKSTFALFFYINKSRKDKQERCPVYLRITVNNTQTAVSIKRSIHPDDWNCKGGFPKGKSQEAKELNNYLSAIRTKLFKVQESLMLKEDCITADMFRMSLFGTNQDKSATIIDLFKEHIDREKNLFLQGKKSDTPYQSYYYTQVYLQKFMQKQYKIANIPVRKIDRQFIDRFIDYLKLQPTVCHNYAMQLLFRLKYVLKMAAKYEIISRNPFDDEISLAVEYSEQRSYLTDKELQQLLSTPMNTKQSEREKDIFCFSVFTGLANTDVMHLTREQLHQVDGNWWIRAYRQKTDVLSVVPLLPQAEAILRKFCPDFETISSSTLIFPSYTVQNRNCVLRRIAKQCGIEKKLTTHVARHTFATTIALTNDVPLETVSKMLGHKSLRMTQHYAKIVNKKIGSDMEKLTAKISGIYQIKA